METLTFISHELKLKVKSRVVFRVKFFISPEAFGYDKSGLSKLDFPVISTTLTSNVLLVLPHVSFLDSSNQIEVFVTRIFIPLAKVSIPHGHAEKLIKHGYY